ncbi:MAG: AAA family ATPase [Candidatus Marinimicrobia bacterium]|nr:AAA family ATPase [Candidatus Neomarinimicrobiota bacterium]
MYLNYWKLKDKPFENTPNPRFLYHSSKHDEAFVRLVYAINSLKGAAMLSGDYGCGKTLLMHTLIQQLPADKFNIAYLTNPRWSAIELIKEILYQLKVETSSTDRADLLHQLYDYLIETFGQGKHTIVIIDEAQSIEQMETLEELRMLLNFQFNDRFLLTLLLIGQPELKEMVRNIPQLDQRIAVRYHLKKFNSGETKDYIYYRLQVAGNKYRLFSDQAIQQIYEYSDGTPRKINNICDLSLLLGFGQRVNQIQTEHIRSIINSES